MARKQYDSDREYKATHKAEIKKAQHLLYIKNRKMKQQICFWADKKIALAITGDAKKLGLSKQDFIVNLYKIWQQYKIASTPSRWQRIKQWMTNLIWRRRR